jgi:hypothetical protein
MFYFIIVVDMLVTLNIILSADANIGRGSRMRIKTLRMRILFCSSAQGSTYGIVMNKVAK